MNLNVTVNGRERNLPQVAEQGSLSEVIAALDLTADRVAVELNGAICSRALWSAIAIRSGDRLEIVHFVGGGSFNAAHAAGPAEQVSG